MDRRGLLVALAIAATIGLLFGIHPELDIKLTAPFYDPIFGFWRPAMDTLRHLRDACSWIVVAVAAPAFLAVSVKLLLPHRPMFMPARAAVLMIATLALGPGLLANVVLKDGWGRPRPPEIVEFGGTKQFTPWWDPRGACDKNCSFVAGEPSGAFWTLAPAALAPPSWRAFAYGTAIAFGAGVGLLRMVVGGHFFTDVVFAGVFMFLVIWLVHGLLYRWRSTRITDAAIEHVLERFTLPSRRLTTWMATRLRTLLHRPGPS